MPLKFYRSRKALAKSTLMTILIFGLWDILATARGHWGFEPDFVWSLRLINLPFEEVLFFVVVPFCSIFTWEAINFIKARRGG
ncbi:MAG: lycopene cyclase domain-containing protein [Actinomycetota bacterium]|nr:lycopene cyclase domain-containing protein [Actinomycetota bacterium]